MGLALVTGGSRGIGAAIARALAANGYGVVLTYEKNALAAHALVDEIIANGGTAQAVQLDISREAAIVDLFRLLDEYAMPLSVLVNNAGVTGGFSRLDALTLEQLHRVFEVNVFGAFLCAREAVRRMGRESGGEGGVIINISSRAAQLGGGGEWIHYAASKGALDSLTVGLAKEVAAQGIRVNGVAPGIIDTDLHADAGKPDRAEQLGASVPLARPGQPAEVADCVVWLASAAAAYVTGAIIPVAGGR
ncbi:SDR family oxidoreductase [Pseudomonas silvicola]|nr:SDR family oxidoreductase [Pseudomonas silvicola]